MRRAGLACLALALAWTASTLASETLRIGSKRFTESYVLGEVLTQTAQRAGTAAEHRPGLGNTAIVYAALKAGAIDLYPEYTGTIAREILKLDADASLPELNVRLAAEGLAAAVPLGFNNTYALAMREAEAARLGVRAISDLARHPQVRLGLSQEFIARADGWSGLVRAYRLPQDKPSGLDHGLAYEAIGAGRVDVIDVYSTDAKIARYALRVLADDRGFFPKYDAVLLHRIDVPTRFPAAWRAIERLAGQIDGERMIGLNAAVELEGRTFAQSAAAYLAGDTRAPGAHGAKRGWWQVLVGDDLWRLAREHLLLTFGALALAVIVGIPLGVLAARLAWLEQPVLGAVGVIQTIPSLALLALLIATMGTIGFWPALVALFLYALLPIVRNTHAGLVGLARGLREAALALGLATTVRLLRIELPLAWPTILAGIKTSAVISVGTATIAAFVGAGGFGERIVQGLAVNDSTLLVGGALPAAVLALLMQGAFELLERRTARWRDGARR